MSAVPSATQDHTPSKDAVERRRAAHRREQIHRVLWRVAVQTISLSLLVCHLCLLLVVRVTDAFYLIVSGFSVVTGLCGILVQLAYQLPTVLEELPRLSPRERAVNLAAIAPMRASLLGQVLPAVRVTRSRAEAEALDDAELIERLEALERPNWRRIALRAFIAWLVLAALATAAVLTYVPPHNISLLDRLKGKSAPIDRRWAPRR